MLELFLIGALSWWLIPFFLVSFIVITAISETGNWWAAIVAFAASAAGFWFLFDINIFTAIWANPLIAILWVVAHLLVGALYTGLWKLPTRLKEIPQHRVEDAFTHSHMSKAEFAKSPHHNPLHPRNHLDVIATWVLMWPFTLTWDLLNRPIRWLYNITYDVCANWFNAISERITGNRLEGVAERSKEAEEESPKKRMGMRRTT